MWTNLGASALLPRVRSQGTSAIASLLVSPVSACGCSCAGWSWSPLSVPALPTTRHAASLWEGLSRSWEALGASPFVLPRGEGSRGPGEEGGIIEEVAAEQRRKKNLFSLLKKKSQPSWREEKEEEGGRCTTQREENVLRNHKAFKSSHRKPSPL